MRTGLTGSPAVTDSLGVTGEPGVVVVPGLPSVVVGTGYRVPVPVNEPEPGLPGPGVTGTCSEYTGWLTGNC